MGKNSIKFHLHLSEILISVWVMVIMTAYFNQFKGLFESVLKLLGIFWRRDVLIFGVDNTGASLCGIWAARTTHDSLSWCAVLGRELWACLRLGDGVIGLASFLVWNRRNASIVAAVVPSLARIIELFLLS